MSSGQTARYGWTHFAVMAVFGYVVALLLGYAWLAALLGGFVGYWTIALVRPSTGHTLHRTLSLLAAHATWLGVAGLGLGNQWIVLPAVAITLFLLLCCVIFLARGATYALMMFEIAAVGIGVYACLDNSTLPLLIDIGYRVAVFFGLLLALDEGLERTGAERPKTPEYHG